MKWELRAELAEAVGTFFMVLVGGGAIVAGQPLLVVAAAFGIVVMVMIYALGHVSGAHFNPAITMAFAATRHFPWARVPTFVLAQLAGAALACVVLLPLAPVASVVAHGDMGGLAGWVVEILASAMLAFVIIAVATDARAAPGAAGLAIGATVFLGALVAGPLTGAAMNPARALAPAVIEGDYEELWWHVAGPVVGAIAGMMLYEGLRHGAKPRSEDVLGTAGPVNLEASA